MPDATPSASRTAPTVSIGMPVYNGAGHLGEALDSLLAQTYTDFEVVICDNSSTDATAEVVADYVSRDSRIRYFRNEENLGAAANFNRVFELSRGTYFMWFAHDDRLGPTHLERCAGVLEAESPEVVLVFPERVETAYDGTVWGPDKKTHWWEAAPPFDRISFARSMLIPDRRFPTLIFGLMPAAVLRKTRLIGAFHCADLVLVAELRMYGQFRQIPEPLFINRIHERRSVEEEAAWYDPENANRLRRPGQRLLRERMLGVWGSEAGFGAKLWCTFCVIVLGQLVARTPPWLAVCFLGAGRRVHQAWERLTVWGVRHSQRHYLAHRAWMLLGGLRRLDFGKLKTALARPSPNAHAALCRFVGEKFDRRRDAGAKQVLAEWRNGTCAHRRAAAQERSAAASCENVVSMSTVCPEKGA